MLGTTVVPEGDRVRLPAEAALEQRIFHVLVEIAQDSLALVDRHADEARGEAAIDVERFLLRHRMGPDHRMLGPGICRAVLLAGEIEQPAIDMLAVMDGGEPGKID